MNKRLMVFAIVCFAIAEYAPIFPEHKDGEYTADQVSALNTLTVNATADDWLSQLERHYYAKPRH